MRSTRAMPGSISHYVEFKLVLLYDRESAVGEF